MKCYTRYVCDQVWHYSGSARMGLFGDRMAVVDDRLRVFGIKGLRVADTSVTPSIVRGNTQAIAHVIGEKAADMIRQDWDSSSRRKLYKTVH